MANVRVMFHGFPHSESYACSEVQGIWRKGESKAVDQAVYARLSRDFGDAFEADTDTAKKTSGKKGG